MALTLDLAIEHDGWTEALPAPDDGDALIRRAADAVLAETDIDGMDAAEGPTLSVLLCDDAAIRALNRRWRGKDAATNVLSFPAAAAMRRFTLGDLAIALETSSREATEAGTPFADYFAHLVVHGLFHLLGHDHACDEEADAMEAAESRALARLGLASPYRQADPPAAEAVALRRSAVAS